MLIDNLTKLRNQKKFYLTPKHPLADMPLTFRLHYCALIILQARTLEERIPVHQNQELLRLMQAGMELNELHRKEAEKLSYHASEAVDMLCQEKIFEEGKFYCMLDLMTVSWADGQTYVKTEDSLRLFARLFQITSDQMTALSSFASASLREDEPGCLAGFEKMHENGIRLARMQLKYYMMTFCDVYTCTQEELNRHKQLHLIDHCCIEEDLVLRRGMRLIFDHAVVRIYGNILLEGGELLIRNSRIIRKSGAHRACINVRFEGKVTMQDSEADCRNFGMFIRAQDGSVVIEKSEIHHTTRGAAVRFWGRHLRIEDSRIHHCYSPEDGGAVLIRGGQASVSHCIFHHCEAVRGGAVCGAGSFSIGECIFDKCYVSEYGAAVYTRGLFPEDTKTLTCSRCFPEGEEIIQHLQYREGLDIHNCMEWKVSTIVDCELNILPQGELKLENAVVYLKRPIRCWGTLRMERSHLIYCMEQPQDMIVLDRARGCQMRECRVDGRGEAGGLWATGTRIELTDSVFCNMKKGRAVFNALSPQIHGCTFNYCMDGGVFCTGGTICDCTFVNCRSKRGAGISMNGQNGLIRSCRFVRCMADQRNGAIEKGLGQRVEECSYENCSL